MPLQIVRDDIINMDVDAIVNSTNNQLIGYSGVDLAIHQASGKELEIECRNIAECPTGKAVITNGYNLKARYIIHTVGPIYQDGDHQEDEILRSCYTSCLNLATRNNCNSIAFPLISAGNYCYPKEDALDIAIDAISNFLKDQEILVYLVLYDLPLNKRLQQIDNHINRTLSSQILHNNQSKQRTQLHMPKMATDSAIFCLYSTTTNEKASAKEDSNIFDSDDLANMIRNMDASFSEILFSLIDKKGITDAQCYKGANIDRKTFNKIKKDNYRPSKNTILAYSISLKLNLDETNELLKSAGYILSDSIKSDVIVKCCIQKGLNINDTNLMLFNYDQQLLGMKTN